MIRALALVGCITLPVTGAAQPENHIGQALADVFVANGCVMSEAAANAALQSQGWHSSDFQAQVLALHRGGYVTRNAEGLLQLTNWGASCK